MAEKFYRSYAEINLGAIDHNLNEIKNQLDSDVKILAVVKADAYGHGLVPVSQHIESKIDFFAVASVDDALTLRENGITKPILNLSFTSPSEYEELVDNDITATIYNIEEAKILSDLAEEKGKKAKVPVPFVRDQARIVPTPVPADGNAAQRRVPCRVHKGQDRNGAYCYQHSKQQCNYTCNCRGG